MHESVLHVIAKHIFVNTFTSPVQSGSNRILKEMNRLHTREEYMTLIDKIRTIIPNSSISQDMIAGFPYRNRARPSRYVEFNGCKI
jgi:tRNA-2-methylthio-N6-dimethylallyladenosine synthase